MDIPPQTYDTTYNTRNEAPETTSVINVAFVKSLGGILKMCEVILSCIVLICVAGARGWSYHSSGGWVNFVAAITLILAALFFLFYLFNVIRRLRGPWVIIEFVTLIFSAFFWFVAFIVSAAMHYYGPGAIAAAIFSAVALAVYIAELVTRFRVAKQPNGFRVTMTGVALASVPPPTTYPATSPASQPQSGPHMGFSGAYSHGEHTDQGYVMP